MKFLSVVSHKVLNQDGSAAPVVDWWKRTDVPIKEQKRSVVLVKPYEDMSKVENSQMDKSYATGSSRLSSAFNSVFSKGVSPCPLPESLRPPRPSCKQTMDEDFNQQNQEKPMENKDKKQTLDGNFHQQDKDHKPMGSCQF